MKKFLLSSLLILMISIGLAESHFLDMRVGDFGCITRVVFEFTGKINYSIQENENNLSISIKSLKEGKIQLPIEESKNISNIAIKEGTGSAQIDIEFISPLEVTSYNYFQENKNYIIVLDVYDTGYITNKEKGLATLLFKAQKFPLAKVSQEISEFSEKYESDSLVNYYLGRLFALKKMKNKAIEYFQKIKAGSEQFFLAQAYIDNLNKDRFPKEEVKPDFLTAIETPENELQAGEELASNTQSNESSQAMQQERSEEKIEDKKEAEEEATPNKFKLGIFSIIYLTISFLIIILLLIQNIKKKYAIRELSVKLEGVNFELSALENKLAKGVVENSKTKEKIIIKLFNSGWKPQDIAEELSTSLELVEATISKEGRL